MKTWIAKISLAQAITHDKTTSLQAFFVDRPHKTNSNLLLVLAEWIICIYFLYVCFCVYRKYHRYRNICTVDCKSEITTHWRLWLNPLNFMTTSSSASWWFFLSILVFFHGHSRITGLQGKGEGTSLTSHYHFHPLHRHLDIGRGIAVENSPLHIASIRSRTVNLWFPSASR